MRPFSIDLTAMGQARITNIPKTPQNATQLSKNTPGWARTLIKGSSYFAIYFNVSRKSYSSLNQLLTTFLLGPIFPHLLQQYKLLDWPSSRSSEFLFHFLLGRPDGRRVLWGSVGEGISSWVPIVVFIVAVIRVRKFSVHPFDMIRNKND